ncbi:MAG: hypothetical protein EZS28_026227 [Streblomastix strix]|uniref:Uncharacterized protein n=1 Tax=Streblomastix strix TaxID=222440 RepID=A0A5J4V6L9_9EUKA|nr:MAG: hypothetical protein EZS28_026227 [Streblomastix strix]
MEEESVRASKAAFNEINSTNCLANIPQLATALRSPDKNILIPALKHILDIVVNEPESIEAVYENDIVSILNKLLSINQEGEIYILSNAIMNVIGLRSEVVDAVVRARAATEPLIQIIHSLNEKQSKQGSKALSDLITENETIRNSLLTTGFAEVVLHTLTSNNQIQSKQSSSSTSDIIPIFIKVGLLDVVLRLVTTAEGLQPLALLIPILEDIKLNGEGELKSKSKKILGLLSIEGINVQSTSNKEELKYEKEEIIRLKEEYRIKDEEIRMKDELNQRINEELRREKEQLKQKDEELRREKEERNRILEENGKLKFENQMLKEKNNTQNVDLKRIAEILRQPLVGTQQQQQQIQKQQEDECRKLINKYDRKKNDEGRQNIINSGIVEALIQIFLSRSLDLITQPYTQLFFVLTHPTSDEIRILIVPKNPYPSLIRLLDHQDIKVVDDVIICISNILNFGSRSTPSYSTHPHFDAISDCDGINQIFRMFKRNDISKHSKRIAAQCFGHLFRAREISNSEMKKEFIAYLKQIITKQDKKEMQNAIKALKRLALNGVNRTEIEKDGFAFPDDD